MNRPTCETCPFWAVADPESLYQECVRFPPNDQERVNFTEGFSGLVGKWPRTHQDEWCGEHPLMKFSLAHPSDRPNLCPLLMNSVRCQKELGHAGEHDFSSAPRK